MTLALVAVIGVAVWRIGLAAWGDYHRRALDEALAARDFVQAEAELARCLWLWPQRPQLHLEAARLARRQGQADEARRRLRVCRSHGELREFVDLEELLLQLEAGQFDNAAQLDRYARQNAASHEALLIAESQIKGSLAALDPRRARPYLDEWMQRRTSPADQVQGLLWQGTACLVALDPDQAMGFFEQALARDPASRVARFSLAELLTSKDPRAARGHLEVLRRQHPDDADILYQQALVQRNLGQLDEAAHTLDALLAASPDHLEGLVLRGRLALDRRQFDEAGRWFGKAESLEPKHRAVLEATIEYLRLTGQDDKARQYQRRSDEIEAEVKAHVEAVLDRRKQGDAQQPGNPAAVQGPAGH